MAAATMRKLNPVSSGNVVVDISAPIFLNALIFNIVFNFRFL